MHKKCSHCELVNWPNDVQCRRCSSELGDVSHSEALMLRPKVQADSLQFADEEDAAFDEAKALIKKGVNAGMIYGGISLLVILFLQAFLPAADGFLKFAWLDIAIIYGLTFGIHLKSRACAGLMLVYYALSKLAMMTQGGIGFIGIFVAIAFVKAFYQGWQGTVLYHQIKQTRTQEFHA
jgi:hypothetical protein